MTAMLVVYSEEKKRPQILQWATNLGGAAPIQPTIGMELCLPQFKKPHFQVERIVAVQNSPFGLAAPWGPGQQAGYGGGYVGGAYGPGTFPRRVSEPDDDQDIAQPEMMGMAQFSVMVICRPCEPFEVPGLPALSK